MWLLIPAKRAILAKSRLSPVLDNDARAVLARLLLARLLTVVSPMQGVEGVVVVSADAGLRAIAQMFGAHSLPDPVPSLNPSLEAGRQVALARGADALLVLPTDLPGLDRAALTLLVEAASEPGPRVVLARDRHGQGTNALFLRPATAIPFGFGQGSAARHRRLAQRAGLPVTEVSHPALAFDLDVPDDWQVLVQGEGGAGAHPPESAESSAA